MTNPIPTNDDPVRRRRHRNERIAAAILVVLAATAAAGVFWWRQRVEEAYQRQVAYIPRPAVMTPESALLIEYVRVDTSTPEGVANGARWLAGKLREGGAEVEIIESAPGRLNVYSRLRGRSRGKGLLLFNHIDVIPAGSGQWNAPPFEGRVSGNEIVGRGTLDMKGLAICQLLAYLDIVGSGRPPEHDLVFLATADEETGSEFGMQWLVANRPDVFEDIRYGLTEGGITEMMTDQMTYFGIEIGGKQAVEVTLRGATIEDARRARIALEPYLTSRFPERILPEVRQYMRDIASTRMKFRPYLEDIDKTVREGKFWALPTSYRDLAYNSVWAGVPSTTGKEVAMTVRLSNLPDEDPEARIAWLERLVAPTGMQIGEVAAKEGPVPISATDSKIFQLLAEEAESRYKVAAGSQLLYRSRSDSTFLRPLGIDCYGICPFPVTYYQSLTIHGANERIRLDYFSDGVEYLRSVIGRWAKGD